MSLAHPSSAPSSLPSSVDQSFESGSGFESGGAFEEHAFEEAVEPSYKCATCLSDFSIYFILLTF
jgi:hypothetical protein